MTNKNDEISTDRLLKLEIPAFISKSRQSNNSLNHSNSKILETSIDQVCLNKNSKKFRNLLYRRGLQNVASYSQNYNVNNSKTSSKSRSNSKNGNDLRISQQKNVTSSKALNSLSQPSFEPTKSNKTLKEKEISQPESRQSQEYKLINSQIQIREIEMNELKLLIEKLRKENAKLQKQLNKVMMQRIEDSLNSNIESQIQEKSELRINLGEFQSKIMQLEKELNEYKLMLLDKNDLIKSQGFKLSQQIEENKHLHSVLVNKSKDFELISTSLSESKSHTDSSIKSKNKTLFLAEQKLILYSKQLQDAKQIELKLESDIQNLKKEKTEFLRYYISKDEHDKLIKDLELMLKEKAKEEQEKIGEFHRKGFENRLSELVSKKQEEFVFLQEKLKNKNEILELKLQNLESDYNFMSVEYNKTKEKLNLSLQNLDNASMKLKDALLKIRKFKLACQQIWELKRQMVDLKAYYSQMIKDSNSLFKSDLNMVAVKLTQFESLREAKAKEVKTTKDKNCILSKISLNKDSEIQELRQLNLAQQGEIIKLKSDLDLITPVLIEMKGSIAKLKSKVFSCLSHIHSEINTIVELYTSKCKLELHNSTRMNEKKENTDFLLNYTSKLNRDIQMLINEAKSQSNDIDDSRLSSFP